MNPGDALSCTDNRLTNEVTYGAHRRRLRGFASMKLHLLLAAVSLGVFVSLSGSAPGHTNTRSPVLMRLGEEYFIRLDNADRRSPSRTEALQLQLTQRQLGGKLGRVGNGIANSFEERERRSEDPPISLDLTFHLLREVLQMARAEQLAQRASNNRKIMDDLGK
ncbi:corticoliberin-1 [Puntigrus tetrazona]|uniref:corticoliberin-1 n=1 Tax=Puntigrus tetrazona TaxID=1606681 RepID=UPI001C8ACC02|nr:corticoliberin-1 [Puntigrus tetrazona]